MPVNAGYEYTKAHGKYLNAKTREEKIEALEEMIRSAPHHKGTDVMLAEFKSKLAKLREQKGPATARKSVTVPKEGEATVCVISLPNAGKSTLLRELTHAEPKIADYEYTTTQPELGMLMYNDVPIQLVEIPSTWTPELLSIARTADSLVLLIDSRKPYEGQKHQLENLVWEKLKRPYTVVMNNEDPDTIARKIWETLHRIRVYTKTPGKRKDIPAVTLAHGATVRDAAFRVHKDFVVRFKFARVYGPSAKFDGQQVGMDHVLLDGDVVEIHID